MRMQSLSYITILGSWYELIAFQLLLYQCQKWRFKTCERHLFGIAYDLITEDCIGRRYHEHYQLIYRVASICYCEMPICWIDPLYKFASNILGARVIYMQIMWLMKLSYWILRCFGRGIFLFDLWSL